MIKMVIEKGTAKNKKLKAIFYDGDKKIKTSQFGQSGAEDYTLTKDKEQRKRYRARHKKDLSKGNYMSPGYLSLGLLWGDSTSLNTNIKNYKKKYNLS